MDKFAAAFEKRFLFSVGRHFWNFVAVCGFIAMATGGVLALNGASAGYQKETDLKKKIEYVPVVEEMPDYGTWLERECAQNLKPLRGYSQAMHATICGRYIWRASKADPGTDKACWAEDWNGKKLGSGTYTEGKCDGQEVTFEFLDGYVGDYEGLYYRRLEENNKEIAKKNEIDSRNSEAEAQLAALQAEKVLKLGLGGIVAAWGLGVVALSALNAALLSIERNTRPHMN